MHTYPYVHTLPSACMCTHTHTHAFLIVTPASHVCFIYRTSFLRSAPACKRHFLVPCGPHTATDLYSQRWGCLEDHFFTYTLQLLLTHGVGTRLNASECGYCKRPLTGASLWSWEEPVPCGVSWHASPPQCKAEPDLLWTGESRAFRLNHICSLWAWRCARYQTGPCPLQ